MKLSDFSLLSSELVQFTCDDELSADWQNGKSVLIQEYELGSYLIRQGDAICTGAVIGNPHRVAMQVRRGLTLWILTNHDDKILQLQWLDLVEQMQLDMAIRVDESIAEYLTTKKNISKANVQSAIKWLSDCFIAEDETPELESGQIFIGHFENPSEKSFLIFGVGWQCQVKRDKNALTLISLTKLRAVPSQLATLIGKISFQDASVAVQLQSTEQQALLESALRDNGSYLRLWEEYGMLEWEQAQECARTLGSLRFKDANLIEGERWAWCLKVTLSDLNDFRENWKNLGLSPNTQVELGEKELNLDMEYHSSGAVENGMQHRPVCGELEFKQDSVILTPNQDKRSERPPKEGFIYYALSGDETVKKRRTQAKQSIQQGCRLPQLRYLLEGVASPSARHSRLLGLSPYSKVCFKGAPTERQKLALDTAINTPDIALIVGPPGTGKTQVIAALQRRLAETLGSEQAQLQHQVLISSYQHDAVDNALNRAEVFGLPAVRIGGRRNEGAIDPIAIWCKNKRDEIADRLELIRLNDPLTRPLTELNDRIIALKLARLSSEESQLQFAQIDMLLRELAELDVCLPPEIRNRWEAFLTEHTQIETQRRANAPAGLIRLVRTLRISPTGFEDDGADRVYQLERTLRRFHLTLAESEWALLQRLSTVTVVSDADLHDLAAFKHTMLDRLIPDYRPPQFKQALSGEAIDLLVDIEGAIDAPLRKSRRGITAVVASYYAALEQTPADAARAVREYASVVGATCQQSAGKAMGNLHALNRLNATENIEFDTVIIDEAARANPLDLFVPMAMARRRIVLVGDHKQLPHLIQRELEDELIAQQNLTDAQAIAYEQSLFERLLRQLREQEKVDNIKRVVMLDTQYRMHPTLGDFISQQFYEPEGLGILHSGRPASDFVHTIPGYVSQCAAWIDVPLHDGKESRQGSSRLRVAEAEVIAREVKRIIDACGPTVSIGVISFYRAQCNCILKQFMQEGLAEEDDESDIVISRSYRQTDAGEERLRVGTVDAFQGKEFDVVFLSVVRTNAMTITSQKAGIEREHLLNRKYGHLRLANRLNVAMSRQRKLLIAVGDRTMAAGAEPEEAIPALAAFLKLCSKEATNGG